MCDPLVSGNDGSHSIHLRQLDRRGVRLHGRVEGVAIKPHSSSARTSRPVCAGGGRARQRMKVMLDAYIAAAGIGASAAESAQDGPCFPEPFRGVVYARI